MEGVQTVADQMSTRVVRGSGVAITESRQTYGRGDNY